MPTPNTDGIDTSHYQTLTSAALPALTFAMHKASEGVKGRDDTLPQFLGRYRVSSQIAHVGAYHWLRSDGPIDAQAANFLAAVGTAGGLQPGEFAVCDWERTYVSTTERQGTIMRRLRRAIPDPAPQQVERWCGLVGAELGRNRVAVYSAPWVTGFAEWRARNPDVALFLANYRTNQLLPLNGWVESKRWNATAWQWTSTGTVPGIGGNCDINHVWKPEWFTALGNPTPPAPAPVEDDMKLYQPNDGDTAIFLAAGGIARWVRSHDELDKLRVIGQAPTGDPLPIDRPLLATLRLAGEAPTYPAGYTGARTYASDFGGLA